MHLEWSTRVRAISAQNKVATESNNFKSNEIHCQLTKDESKKDQTKKMIACTAAATSNDINEDLPATLTCFVNCEYVGMAQYDLVHQFKEPGFPYVAFALGTTQALFIGEFLYSILSTPSNFTVFAFHEQDPNSNNCQQDYLICHLLQIEGKEIIRRDKSITQTSSSHTFQLQWTMDTDPAFCSCIRYSLWH
jgi:hypothetical protein